MAKDFKEWMEQKEKLHERHLSRQFYVKEGEIWWCSLGTNIGIETDGKGMRSLRPVLIVKVFNKEHIWVVPLTTYCVNDIFHLALSSVKDSSVILSQMRTISSQRLFKILAVASEQELALVKQRLGNFLKIETPACGGGILTPPLGRGNNPLNIADLDKKSIDTSIFSCNNVEMNQEFEVKILDIDVADIEKKLEQIGAIKKGDFFYRSATFDYLGFTLDAHNAWLRLRDEGDKATLAYKRRLGVTSNKGNDAGTEEIEIEVSDFEKTREILLKIGLMLKFAQEKRRTRWTKEDVTFDIDTWPRLKPYLEIEGVDEKAVDKGMAWLDIDAGLAKRFSTTQVYELNGINDKDYIKMGFDEFVKRG